MALLGRSNDHDESGDDVVSRNGDAEQEHRVEEASQVVDRVLKIPRRLINVRLLICPCPKVNVNKLRGGGSVCNLVLSSRGATLSKEW